MFSITVAQMLQLPILKDAVVLEGHGGLDNLVLSATFFDAPDGYSWWKKGDFVFTTGYPTVSNGVHWEDGLRKLMDMIIEKEVSGIGIKLGRYIPEISVGIKNLASKHRIPLVSIPTEYSWSDYLVPIVSYINNQQRAELEKVHAVYESYYEHLDQNGSLQDLADLLAYIVDTPVTLAIPSFNQVLHSVNFHTNEEQLDKFIFRNVNTTNKLLHSARFENERALVRFVRGKKQVDGGIFLWNKKLDSLQAWEKVAIEQTAAILKTAIDHLREVASTYQRFRNDFLSLLISDFDGPSEVLKRRAHEVGWDLQDKYAALILECELKPSKRKTDKLQIWQEKNNILGQINKQMTNFQIDCLTGYDLDNRIVILIADQQDYQNKVNNVQANIQKLMSTIGSVQTTYGGMGRMYNLEEYISTSYKEAITSLNLVKKETLTLPMEEKLNTTYLKSYSDLYLERVLFSADPLTEARKVAGEYLAKLIEHDKKRNSELLNTLKIFLESNANHTVTAESLFVHKNTVRYRLELIHKITGFSPEKIEHQLLYHMALKLI